MLAAHLQPDIIDTISVHFLSISSDPLFRKSQECGVHHNHAWDLDSPEVLGYKENDTEPVLEVVLNTMSNLKDEFQAYPANPSKTY